MANSAAAAAAVAVAILRSCPVCHPPAVANLCQPPPHCCPFEVVTQSGPFPPPTGHQPWASSQTFSPSNHPGAEAAEGKESMVDGKCHWQWHSFACNWLSQLVAFYCLNVVAPKDRRQEEEQIEGSGNVGESCLSPWPLPLVWGVRFLITFSETYHIQYL